MLYETERRNLRLVIRMDPLADAPVLFRGFEVFLTCENHFGGLSALLRAPFDPPTDADLIYGVAVTRPVRAERDGNTWAASRVPAEATRRGV